MKSLARAPPIQEIQKQKGKNRDIAEHHLIPKLGDYTLQELTPLIVQCYITELLQHGNLKNGNPLSANTVNTIITVIQGSMSTAHLLGFTDKYEMDKLKRPKAKEKPVESFTPTEQKLIEQAVMADRREKMKGIIICLYTGLRIGELSKNQRSWNHGLRLSGLVQEFRQKALAKKSYYVSNAVLPSFL